MVWKLTTRSSLPGRYSHAWLKVTFPDKANIGSILTERYYLDIKWVSIQQRILRGLRVKNKNIDVFQRKSDGTALSICWSCKISNEDKCEPCSKAKTHFPRTCKGTAGRNTSDKKSWDSAFVHAIRKLDVEKFHD